MFKTLYGKNILLLLALCFSFAAYTQNFKIENNQLVLDKPVEFRAGTAEIVKESEAVLNSIKTFLDQKTYISQLRVEGHVDGSDKAQNLSEQRALAIAKWLVQHGADCKRLIAVGFGATKPIYGDDAPEKALNTRIVFAIAALRDKLIGGMPADGGGQSAGDACK